MAGLWRALGAAIAFEQDHFFLWLPVLFGGGIAIYFWLPQEPPAGPLWVAALLACGLALGWRRGLASLMVGGGLAGITLGLAMAKLASDRIAAPVIEKEMRAAHLKGWVELSEPRPGGGERITVRLVSIEGMLASAVPMRVRVRVPDVGRPLVPGAPVALSASLLPPGGPVLPGSYDFARTAWFLGLGGVGYSRTRPEPAVIEAPMPLDLWLWGKVERLRQHIGQRITNALAGDTGAIAASLIMGERGGITDAATAAYRDSGIIHILSISGLHMTVFAGAVYFSVRFLLSLSPMLALCYPIKKWAALAGIGGTYGYLMISGCTPPAVRSAIMISVMFVAVLLDRPALALRNVALAALVILVLTPQSLIDVGFQMSFAAVVSLISGIEAWTRWRRSRTDGVERTGSGPVVAVAAFLGTIMITTVIATVSVAPFGAYYFHKSTQYGMLANLVAIPICNLLVMPASLAALIGMTVGLEAWPLWAMGLGIDAMTWIAYRVAALPGAVAQLPEISTLSFGLMVAGGLWLALWSGRMRLAGVLPVLIGLTLAPLRVPPDVLVSANGGLIAVRGPDGRLAAIDQARSTFELGRWLEHDADARTPSSVGAGRVITCDAVGCAASVKGDRIAIARHASALRDDCGAAAVIIWSGHGRPDCRRSAGGTPLIVTREALSREGTHVLRRGDTGFALETVAGWRGRRPWSQGTAARGGVPEAPLDDGHLPRR